ncbi:MAG: hypothetical protein H7A36_01870 [Chlamydiales bacterium]|nr:hypothetical protein [Chlamydiales bacterium]
MRKVLPLLLLLCSCARHEALKARSEYLNSTYLASTQVRTPEPCYPCFVGEQVIVSWNLPRKCPLKDTDMVLTLRFGDQEVDQVMTPIGLHNGYWIYRLLNKEYWTHDGISSYSAKIVHNGEVLYQWDHHLWQELIIIEE